MISELDQNQGGGARIVGVAYGAHHIRAVARLLFGCLGYRVVKGECRISAYPRILRTLAAFAKRSSGRYDE